MNWFAWQVCAGEPVHTIRVRATLRRQVDLLRIIQMTWIVLYVLPNGASTIRCRAVVAYFDIDNNETILKEVIILELNRIRIWKLKGMIRLKYTVTNVRFLCVVLLSFVLNQRWKKNKPTSSIVPLTTDNYATRNPFLFPGETFLSLWNLCTSNGFFGPSSYHF